MSLIRISGPPELCVSLVELKEQCRIAQEDSSQDAMLVGHLRAAQDSIEGARGWLGIALTTQTWRMTLDGWPACEVIQIPLPPAISVDSVSYIDVNGAEQAILDYVVYGIGGNWPARLAHAYGTSWPATRAQGDAISITFTCGYGSFTDVPESLRAAVLLLAAALYEGCESDAAKALLMPHRVW